MSLKIGSTCSQILLHMQGGHLLIIELFFQTLYLASPILRVFERTRLAVLVSKNAVLIISIHYFASRGHGPHNFAESSLRKRFAHNWVFLFFGRLSAVFFIQIWILWTVVLSGLRFVCLFRGHLSEKLGWILWSCSSFLVLESLVWIGELNHHFALSCVILYLIILFFVLFCLLLRWCLLKYFVNNS